MAITKATASSIAPAAKGDLVVGSATNDAGVLAVGTNAHILVADSTETLGMKWAAPAAAALVGCSLTSVNPVTTLTNNTYVSMAFDAEQWDTDNFHSNTTNNTRITIPSGKGGKYLFLYKIVWDNNWGSPNCNMILRLNGTTDNGRSSVGMTPVTDKNFEMVGSVILDIPAGDYVELRCYQNSGTNRTPPYNNNVQFSATYLGA